MVASLRKALPHPKGHGQLCRCDTQADELGCDRRVEATDRQHSSEIQHMGKGRAVQHSKCEYKATPAERSQKRMERDEATSKRDKLHRSRLPRLEGAVPELEGSHCWDWDGPGMTCSSRAQICRLLKKGLPSPWVCFPIAVPES